MKRVSLIGILAALMLSSAFAAPEWKPYDDFEGDLDAIDETPGTDTRPRHQMGTVCP